MPAARRGGSAYAQIDRQLAEWLTTEGHPTSPSRVAGWRAAGLLPAPTGRARGGGRNPGRVAVAWMAAEWADVQAIGLRLVHATGRGKSTTAAVLRLAGDGLPVPPLTVLAAAREHLAMFDRDVQAQLGVRDLRLTADADPEAAADVVDAVLRCHPGVERAVARRLNGARPSDTYADALSVAFLLLGALLGLPPDPDDDEALFLSLSVLRLHGLIDPVGGADGPRVLSTLAEAAHAIGRFSLADLSQLLAEFPPGEVHASLRVTRELGEALRAVPAGLADHLAADQLAEVLLEDSPTAVVLRLVCWQAIRRDTGATPDIAPIVDAIAAAGWLTTRG